MRKRSVLVVCVEALGLHRGALAAAKVGQWAIATAELGHVPTTVEYADYWAVDERTGWRHRSDVRAVFGDDWPAVVEVVAAEMLRRQSRGRSPAAAATVEVSV